MKKCKWCGQDTPGFKPRELKRMRKLTGLTLRQFSKAANLSAPYLCRMEKGNDRITIKIINLYKRIALKFQVKK